MRSKLQEELQVFILEDDTAIKKPDKKKLSAAKIRELTPIPVPQQKRPAQQDSEEDP